MLAGLVLLPSQSFANDEEITCLALNVYHEARSEKLEGQIAVAQVTMNRVKHDWFPDTVCNAVKQGYSKGLGKCQFSWYCDGKSDWPTNMDAWVESQHVAYNMMTYGDFVGITEGATHYHAKYVSPDWSRHFTLIGRIGEHIFYRQD